MRRSEDDLSIVVLRDAATWVPYAFDRVGYRTFANLREADVSTKPATWTGLAERPHEKLDKTLMEKTRAELALVKGAPLRRVDLRHADAYRAFLVKADLSGAKLQGANLSFAKLQGADLSFARLQGANLDSANLQGANLSPAILQGANLDSANLQGANLGSAQDLTREQLDEACGDDETTLPDYLGDYQMKPCPTPEQSPAN